MLKRVNTHINTTNVGLPFSDDVDDNLTAVVVDVQPFLGQGNRSRKEQPG